MSRQQLSDTVAAAAAALQVVERLRPVVDSTLEEAQKVGCLADQLGIAINIRRPEDSWMNNSLYALCPTLKKFISSVRDAFWNLQEDVSVAETLAVDLIEACENAYKNADELMDKVKDIVSTAVNLVDRLTLIYPAYSHEMVKDVQENWTTMKISQLSRALTKITMDCYRTARDACAQFFELDHMNNADKYFDIFLSISGAIRNEALEVRSCFANKIKGRMDIAAQKHLSAVEKKTLHYDPVFVDESGLQPGERLYGALDVALAQSTLFVALIDETFPNKLPPVRELVNAVVWKKPVLIVYLAGSSKDALIKSTIFGSSRMKMPGAHGFMNTPGALDFMIMPGALGFMNTPGALDFMNMPGALGFMNTPGALDFMIMPGALGFMNTPGALDFMKMPGALGFMNTPGALDFMKTLAARDFVNSPRALDFMNMLEARDFVNIPGARDFMNTPGALDFMKSLAARVFKDHLIEKKDFPEWVEQIEFADGNIGDNVAQNRLADIIYSFYIKSERPNGRPTVHAALAANFNFPLRIFVEPVPVTAPNVDHLTHRHALCYECAAELGMEIVNKLEESNMAIFWCSDIKLTHPDINEHCAKFDAMVEKFNRGGMTEGEWAAMMQLNPDIVDFKHSNGNDGVRGFMLKCITTRLPLSPRWMNIYNDLSELKCKRMKKYFMVPVFDLAAHGSNKIKSHKGISYYSDEKLKEWFTHCAEYAAEDDVSDAVALLKTLQLLRHSNVHDPKVVDIDLTELRESMQGLTNGYKSSFVDLFDAVNGTNLLNEIIEQA